MTAARPTASADELIAAGGLVPPAQPYDGEQVEEVPESRLPQDFRELLDAGGDVGHRDGEEWRRAGPRATERGSPAVSR